MPPDPLPVSSLDDEVEAHAAGAAGAADVPCAFLTGQAGTGKTYSVRESIAQDPHYGKLCATTGISAVNLDTNTINSVLRYFDTNSMRDAYLQGSLTTALHKLVIEGYQWLVIDEVSMMEAAQLQLLYWALRDANSYKDVKQPMGLYLVADFAQLPPVQGEWAFTAECWPQFQANTSVLTKVWRQEKAEFLAALSCARRGQGAETCQRLSALGTVFETALDIGFDGTTIVSKNNQVDRYNQVSLDRLSGRKFSVQSRRWGRQHSQWKLIPNTLELKLGAYVMILSNDTKEWKYANGDCGHIVDRSESGAFLVELVRNKEIVYINTIVRDASSNHEPSGWSHSVTNLLEQEYLPYLHTLRRKYYVEGQIQYYPMRLAYASTCHKSQGLTLDRAQIDIRDRFFSSYNMLYVAISRVRTVEGLRIVGQPERFVKHCNVDPRVSQWL